MVKACKDGEEKIIRFGQQGVKGAGKNPKTAKEKARKRRITLAITHKTANPIRCQHVIGHIKGSGDRFIEKMLVFLSFLTFFTVAYLSGILFLVQAKLSVVVGVDVGIAAIDHLFNAGRIDPR